MTLVSRQFRRGAAGWTPTLHLPEAGRAQLVVVFGCRPLIEQADALAELAVAFPDAVVAGCSTAGEIANDDILDQSLVATALCFERSWVSAAHVQVGADDARAGGRALGEALRAPTLRHVIVLADGVRVNGSALVRGLTEALGPEVTVSGGLAGDDDRFEQTRVCLNGAVVDGGVVALGLHGHALRVGCGSLGGWDPFGPHRLITRSDGAVLYELDGRPALDLYKLYLGDHAAELPASGLLFPLSLRLQDSAEEVVRTVVGVDEATRSLRFAGDVPTGAFARLMKANVGRLIEGALGAARATEGAAPPDLALLISCVGRRRVMRQRTIEEIEGVREVLGDRPVLLGFYSYGEISPFRRGGRCELHNQTMTITTIAED